MADDAALCERWAAGDRAAGEQLVDRHLRGIARFFANKVANREDAHDLVSETFSRLASALDRFRGDSSFRGYLFGIAKNVLRDYVSRQGKGATETFDTGAIGDFAPSPSSVVGRKREHKLLLAALRAIPLHAQIVLELMYFEGMERNEIAEALELPPGTVASRILRGRAQLRQALEVLAESPQELETTTAGLEGWMAEIKKAAGAE